MKTTDSMKTTDLMNDHEQTSQDVDETREPWERPRLTRLAMQNTLMNPVVGGDGGSGFNSLS